MAVPKASQGNRKPGRATSSRHHDPGAWGHPAAINVFLSRFGDCRAHVSPAGKRRHWVYPSAHKGAARFPNRELGGKEKFQRELMLCWGQPPTYSAGLGIGAGRGSGTPGGPPCLAMRCSGAAVMGSSARSPLPRLSRGHGGAPSLQGEGECVGTQGARLPAGTEVMPGAVCPLSCPCLAPRQGGTGQQSEGRQRVVARATRAYTEPGWPWSSPPPQHGLLQPLGSLAALPAVEIMSGQQWQRQLLRARGASPHGCSLRPLCRDSGSSLPRGLGASGRRDQPLLRTRCPVAWEPHGEKGSRGEPLQGWPLGSPSLIPSGCCCLGGQDPFCPVIPSGCPPSTDSAPGCAALPAQPHPQPPEGPGHGSAGERLNPTCDGREVRCSRSHCRGWGQWGSPWAGHHTSSHTDSFPTPSPPWLVVQLSLLRLFPAGGRTRSGLEMMLTRHRTRKGSQPAWGLPRPRAV